MGQPAGRIEIPVRPSDPTGLPFLRAVNDRIAMGALAGFARLALLSAALPIAASALLAAEAPPSTTQPATLATKPATKAQGEETTEKDKKDKDPKGEESEDKDKDKKDDKDNDKDKDKKDKDKKEPRRLVGKLPGTKIDVSGWLDMGITANGDRPRSRYNGTLAPNDRDEFQFNQTYLVMERALETHEHGRHRWDAGGRVDLLFGSDYIFDRSIGLETRPDGSPKWDRHFQYGLVMPQAYGEVGYGDLSVKLGHFYALIGYESTMAPDNFFYSTSYVTSYAEPTTHTGGLATWKPSEEWTLYTGGVNGQDRTDGLVDSLATLAGLAYKPKSDKYSCNFNLMTGGLEPTLVPSVFAPRTYLNTYYTLNFTDKCQSVTQWDLGWQQNYDLEGHTADFWGVSQYVFYTFNSRWKAGLRYDMFADDQGTRLGGLRFGGLPGGNPLPLPSGNAGTVQAITAGLNYTPSANFRLRPEVRWDWYGGQELPLFDDRQKNGQFTAAVDLILLF